MDELPWPEDVKVPRWARGRRGKPAPPDVLARFQLGDLDLYHIGLYRLRGVFKHVVAIIEPSPASAEMSRSPSVKITRVPWLKDPLAVFEQTVDNYMALARYTGDHRN